jgi:hypothetical protein
MLINTINDIIKKIKNMIKTFEQFISESCSSPNCMLRWTDADKVDYRPLDCFVMKKKNNARKGEYIYRLLFIPMGGVDMPMSKDNDTPISEYIKTCESAINVEDIQDWNTNDGLKTLKFGDHCLLRYPRFEMEKRLDPKRCEENPWHYEVQMYLGGDKFDGVDHKLSSELNLDTIEWCKLN